MNSQLPTGWDKRFLRELVSHFESGKRPKGGVAGIAGGVRSLGGEHLSSSGKLLNKNMRFVPEDFAKGLEHVKVREDDILIVKDGATTGKTCLADQTFAGSVINEHLFQARPWDGILPRYLFYFLWSSSGNAEIMKDFRGTAQGGITKSVLEVCEVPIAPTSEQGRIVEKIETIFAQVDKGEEGVRDVQKLLTRYRQSVLRAAITGQLTAKWRCEHAGRLEHGRDLLAAIYLSRRGEPIGDKLSKSSEGTESSELQELPSGWVWAKMEQLFDVYGGATPSRREPRNWGGSVHWVSSGEVAFRRISDTKEKITDLGFNSCSTKLHPVGTVLLAMIGEGKTRGQAAILDVPASNNQNAAAIRVSETIIPPEFIYYYLLSNYDANRQKGQGGNQPALNGYKVKNFDVPICSLEEMIEIVRLVEERFSSIEVMTNWCATELKRATSLRRSILKEAFAGRLVPQDPTDEPASTLLARIAAEKTTAKKPRRKTTL